MSLPFPAPLLDSRFRGNDSNWEPAAKSWILRAEGVAISRLKGNRIPSPSREEG